MATKSSSNFYACHFMSAPDLNDYDMQVKEMYLPLIQELYHQTLLVEDAPMAYLQRIHGIGLADIRHFKLGFCNRQLGKQLPSYRKMEGVKLRGALSHLKILHSSGHEAFRGCVTVPVFWQNEIVGYYGERIERAQRGAPSYYWHPIGHLAVFNLDNVSSNDVLYFCQSPLIAIQMMKALDGKVIATDPHYTLQRSDIESLVAMGVKELCFVKSAEVSPITLMQLSKQLAACGIRYSAMKLDMGGAYGTA
ncbi:hypothetical protein [uncultured Pseudoalteromonas sp.]|uniref:hypothetical protein n=1 Tax=uncultured Pseudoalteromonas sp. TaxID=114053 RepID=UPI0025987696|nr:hypothetical protein [uncultured Pseudoalteromonas sp.]